MCVCIYRLICFDVYIISVEMYHIIDYVDHRGCVCVFEFRVQTYDCTLKKQKKNITNMFVPFNNIFAIVLFLVSLNVSSVRAASYVVVVVLCACV